jgi:hypothetical protein
MMIHSIIILDLFRHLFNQILEILIKNLLSFVPLLCS